MSIVIDGRLCIVCPGVVRRWTGALDYDAYQADWLGLATSSKPDWSPATQLGSSLPGLAGGA